MLWWQWHSSRESQPQITSISIQRQTCLLLTYKLFALKLFRFFLLQRYSFLFSGRCYKTFFGRNIDFPKIKKKKNSLFWCVNLHENVKTMPFLFKSIQKNCLYYISSWSSLWRNLDFFQKQFYNINCWKNKRPDWLMANLYSVAQIFFWLFHKNFRRDLFLCSRTAKVYVCWLHRDYSIHIERAWFYKIPRKIQHLGFMLS